MRAAVLFLAALLPSQDADQDRIDKLVRDLGSDDFEVRRKADDELRKIGEPAAAALKRAAEDPDAERAMRARNILRDIGTKKERKPGPGVSVRFFDSSKGVTFKMEADGRVELTVPEKNPDTGKLEYRTYRADSLDEFKEKHPEIAKRHDVDSMVPRPMTQEEFEKWWSERRRAFGSPFDEWFSEQGKLLEELRKRFGEPAPMPVPTPGRREGTFGVRIAPVSETLRSQLELGENEGVLVEEVEPRSLAEKSGARKHDILTKLDGRKIEDRWQFRQDIRDALASKEFTVEILRGGKRLTMTVKPQEK